MGTQTKACAKVIYDSCRLRFAVGCVIGKARTAFEECFLEHPLIRGQSCQNQFRNVPDTSLICGSTLRVTSRWTEEARRAEQILDRSPENGIARFDSCRELVRAVEVRINASDTPAIPP